MPFYVRRAAVAAAFLVLSAPVLADQVAPQQSAAQPPARCGGLICDMFYSANQPAQPGAVAPAAGEPGSIFLPCHDFVCAMFGGRTPEQPIAAAAPEPAPAETAAKPKKKRSAKHVAERTAKNETKAAEPAAK